MPPQCSVYFVVSGFPTHPKDVEVPGTYRMEMDAGLSPETKAMAALYAFHDNVPVKKDVDFSFLALDEHGNELEECVPWDIPACYRIDSRGFPSTARSSLARRRRRKRRSPSPVVVST